MNIIKNFMLKNPFLSMVTIFPFALFITFLLFSFFFQTVLPIIISLFLTKKIYHLFIKKEKKGYRVFSHL
ncbi:MAG: hypothetical protein CMG55_01500 [Candidatus Marinimicrobia bacterium]|nr:hypothetical protein [Candidatus Neomarinimicrobiota bacterium]